jgi:DNA invertase Pin-like site-specific DNA recombinase
MSGKFVAYYRVSTKRQGATGLGLDAQRRSVSDFLNGGTLLDEFTDIESGRKDDRPRLAQAIALAKRQKATLVIAKLDRLSRRLSFVAKLMESGVRFVAVDNPSANELTIHILAAVAEAERKAISERTKSALAAAKRRGVVLGNPALRQARKGALKAAQAAADQFAGNVTPVIRGIQSRGVTSLRGIAEALNARGLKTRRGGLWTAVAVSRVVERAGCS